MKKLDMPRRIFLRGAAGAVMALPWLESLAPRSARAQPLPVPGFAIFLRQANGVAQAQTTTELGAEPERFFAQQDGPLTVESMEGRAVEELSAYRDRLLVLKNVQMEWFDYGDGHAMGALQGLTARGPTVPFQGGSSEADGESIDHRIGRALNPPGRESLFLFAGQGGGWLNGPCISYRGPGQRRAALHNPWSGYLTVFGAGASTSEQEALRRATRTRSVNDLVRDQLRQLLAHPRLGRVDRERLDLHLSSVRDLEVQLSCRLSSDEEAVLEGASPGYDSTDGAQVLETARLHLDVAALAVACGLTRSVALQIGVGNDQHTRYRHPESGAPMENYHYISHRRLSHSASGDVIGNADLLHHFIDRQFAQTFKHLLDRLASLPGRERPTLLEEGVSCWYNDNATGPPHGIGNVPWILAGSAGGFLKQGEQIKVQRGSSAENHARLLNTIASAVGVRKADGSFLDDFGDPGLPRGLLDELLA